MLPTIESMRPAPSAPATATPAPLGLARELVLVAAGGMLGALARAAFATRTANAVEMFALSTQLVNAMGAFALGLLLATLERSRPRPSLRPFLAVGVLGSFTTFSTLVDDGRLLASGRSPLLALAFLALSIAAGLLAFLLGQWLGEGLGPWRGRGGRDGPRSRGRTAP